MHAHYVLAWTGLYLSQFGSYQKDKRYVGNWRDMLVMTMMSEHMHASMHACQHACTLFSGMLRPISQSNQVQSERSKYLLNKENMPDPSKDII